MTDGAEAVIVLPRALRAGASSEDIEGAIREAIGAQLGPNACTGVTVRSQPRALPRGHIEAVAVALDGARLDQLPLSGSPPEFDRSLSRGRIEELRFDVTHLEVGGLITSRAYVVARQVDYALEVGDGVSRVWLSAMATGEATLCIGRPELVRTIERRVAAIRSLEVALRPGGWVEARGTVRVGPLKVRGTLSGQLAIANGAEIVLRDIDLRAGILGAPQAARQTVLRSVNPLIDVGALLQPPFRIRLTAIETTDEQVTVSAVLSPNALSE